MWYIEPVSSVTRTRQDIEMLFSAPLEVDNIARINFVQELTWMTSAIQQTEDMLLGQYEYLIHDNFIN